MVNLSTTMANATANATNMAASYPIKPDYLRFALIVTIIFVGLGMLLFFFSKFNKELTKKAK